MLPSCLLFSVLLAGIMALPVMEHTMDNPVMDPMMEEKGMDEIKTLTMPRKTWMDKPLTNPLFDSSRFDGNRVEMTKAMEESFEDPSTSERYWGYGYRPYYGSYYRRPFYSGYWY